MKGKENSLAVIVQCRLSSTRLPGKAVKDLGGRTVLEWTLSSMKKVNADYYYVATDEASYETLAPLCKKCGFEIFSGPLEDVLERYCLLIEKLGCAKVLRATADNPFLFYEAASLLVSEFDKQSAISKVDYMTWTGLPHGSGVEIFRADSLLKARNLTNLPFDHEHVGPALYNHKNLFSSLFYKAPSRFYFPELRTTIDTIGDYRRAVSVVKKLSDGIFPGEPYTTEQIVSAVKDPFVHDTVLFLPSVKKGQGTGHLRRCLECASKINGFVYIPEDSFDECKEVVNTFLKESGEFKDFQIVRSFPEKNEYSLIVTDLFSTEKELFKNLREAGKIISIDEGGTDSDYSDYLLDIIPSYKLERKSNLTESGFISLPKHRKESKVNILRSFLKNGPEGENAFEGGNNFQTFPKNGPEGGNAFEAGTSFQTFSKNGPEGGTSGNALEAGKSPLKVLITFGGEDPFDFSEKAVLYFSKSGFDVSVILPNAKKISPLMESLSERGKLTVLRPFSELKESLYLYDLVATHYGLTAYEAKAAGCEVLLFPISRLHEKLSKTYGSTYGFSLFDMHLLEKDFDPDSFIKLFSENKADNCFEEKSLPAFIKNLSHARKFYCPVCSSKENLEGQNGQKDKIDSVVARTEKRTYRRCSNCQIVYLAFSTDGETDYGKEYFESEYKKQYGKTYLEDFSSIKTSGERRIQEINSVLKVSEKKKPSILDIGCAYGPFLKACEEDGWFPFGTDISAEGVSYVQNTLLIPAVKSAFPDFDSVKEFGLNQFDAVTMWFVIEHFTNLYEVLSKVSSLVKKGGVFAFSTPSLEGVSGKKNTEKFFQESPKDHYTIWEQSKAQGILKEFGFKVVKVVSTGHHPERFPYIKRHDYKKGSLPFKVVGLYSNLCSLGDTVEIYCRKEY